MRKLILIFGLLIIATGCNNNDDELNPIIPDDNNTPDHEIVATWNLVKFRQYSTYNYNGEIKWTFNSDDTINVVIQQGTVLNPNLPLNITDVYLYNIEECTQEGVCIILLDGTQHLSQIINNELIINSVVPLELDGYQLTFELEE